jgi:EAL and modified HD-GYP domain-containing signal transduction protein
LHASGSTLLLKGRPLQELPREVLPCFKYSIIDLADERRLGENTPRPA